MANRARRRFSKAQTATPALLEEARRFESGHAPAHASEIRLRGPQNEQRDEDRDTDPAPPPAFENEARGPFSDLDRELTLDLLRLEDTLGDRAKRPWATHLVAVIGDVEALADALFALWSQTRTEHPSWSHSLPRIYEWGRDALAEISDALETDVDAKGVARSFARIASYSSLLVDGLIGPALAHAISIADIEGDSDEVARLRVIHERIALLKWTLLCGARSGP